MRRWNDAATGLLFRPDVPTLSSEFEFQVFRKRLRAKMSLSNRIIGQERVRQGI